MLAEAIQFPTTDTMARAWHMALTEALVAEGINPVSAEEFAATVRHLMVFSRFRPTPADVWDYVKGKRAEMRERQRLQIEGG